jgi:hypothetical protein
MWIRQRFQKPFQQRLADFIAAASEQVILLPAGRERDDLRHKIAKARAAATFDSWANSPGLRPPKK